jgi:chromosome segregation ATPase
MASIAPDETLEARKAALTEQLEAMHLAPDVVELVARADAAFQARKAKFADIEEQIANLDREIGARERTRRADAERERQDRWQAQRAELVAEADVFLGAIAAAESATRDLVRALDVIIASNGRIAALARELSVDRKAPTAANPMELVSRMAGRIASVMSTVKGHRNRLGPLDWPGGLVGLFPSNVSWREAKRLEAALVQPILTKGKA